MSRRKPSKCQQISYKSVCFLSYYLQDSEKVRIFASEKVLLGSEGPGSTKAVYVAQAGLFLFFIVVPELRRGELPMPVRHAPKVFGNSNRRCVTDVKQFNIVAVFDLFQNVEE